jgi:hypothetical protein
MQQLNVSGLDAAATELGMDKGEFFLQVWEEENPSAEQLIRERTQERVTESRSPELVTRVALARYFRVIDAARLEVQGMFSEEEVMSMLHAHPHETLTDEFSERAADIFYSAFGEDLLPVDSPEYRLCEKLAGLSTLQELALIDILECAWRSRRGMTYAMEHLTGKSSDLAMT